MKSVGEAMAIGRTFKEALQKGLRSLEIGASGLDPRSTPREALPELLRNAGPDRIFAIGDALRAGISVEDIQALSAIARRWLRLVIATLWRR